MYDNWKYCHEYKELKDSIADFINGDIEDLDIYLDPIENRVQALYNEGKLTSSQYDDLMSYIQDIKL